MTQQSRKRGIPVLAYPKCDDASPVSVCLVFKCNESRAQATLSLQHSLQLYGMEKSQVFTLQYDADSLRSCTLGPATIPLPQARLDEIARRGNPYIRTLSLTLTTCCPVWYPPSRGDIVPQHGYESRCQDLVRLAKATQLCVLFDYNWLHPSSHAIFQRLVTDPTSLTGFPVQRYYEKHYKVADWTVFTRTGNQNTPANVDADAEETTEDEEPPPYAEASNKRVRPISTSPEPYSPPAKRALLSPYPEYIPTSPTEKDSVAIPSPKVPYLPKVTMQDLQDAVSRAVTTVLPSMLEASLTDLLPRLFTVASSPSPSHSTSASSSTSISPQPVSSLGTLLSACMAKKVEKELQNIYGQTLSHANYLRNTADVEFFEALEEHRIDLVMVKEDAVAELEKMVTDTLEAFREQCEDVGEASLERVAEKADDICDNVTQRLHEREQGGKGRSKCEREELRRDRGWLGWEKEVLERDKRRFEHERRQKNECSDSETRDRRAGSAPL